jgi:hypothetical protein
MHLEHEVVVFVENIQPMNFRHLAESRVIAKSALIHLYTNIYVVEQHI